MTEHTPGPWELHHQSPEFRGSDCDWSLQTETAGAFLLFCHHPEAPADANGRLIAAAPDMLEALKNVYEHIADPARGPRDLYPAFGLNSGYILEAVAAAIAKATQSHSSAMRESK